MANTFKKVIDRLLWAQVAPLPNAHAAGAAVCSDLRSDLSRNPFVYQLVSAAILNRFNIVTKASAFTLNPALAGTFGGGAAAASWTANTGGRGSTYQMENAVLFGGFWGSSSNSGSRASGWYDSPTTSYNNIGARGVCDHLILD